MGRVVAPVLLALAASACSLGRGVSPEAFGRGASFAVVNVNSAERIHYSETTLVHNPAGGLDTGGRGFDAGPAAGVFPETKAAALRALSRSGRFRLVPERNVLASPAYAAAPAHTGEFFGGARFIPARGYKLLFDQAAAGRVAAAVGATAALVVNLQHGYTSAGAGRLTGRVTVMITAIDRSGGIVWTDFAAETSERTVAAPSTKVSPERIKPLLVESTERGVRAMLQRLEENLSGRR